MVRISFVSSTDGTAYMVLESVLTLMQVRRLPGRRQDGKLNLECPVSMQMGLSVSLTFNVERLRWLFQMVACGEGDCRCKDESPFFNLT
jgi:hypothetical protein